MIRRPPRSTLLSLHDALPIYCRRHGIDGAARARTHLSANQGCLGSTTCAWAETRERPRYETLRCFRVAAGTGDRKSTRLNSSHQIISYAVFCLKKKKNIEDVC